MLEVIGVVDCDFFLVFGGGYFDYCVDGGFVIMFCVECFVGIDECYMVLVFIVLESEFGCCFV